jgi:hypothetical protein
MMKTDQIDRTCLLQTVEFEGTEGSERAEEVGFDTQSPHLKGPKGKVSLHVLYSLRRLTGK